MARPGTFCIVTCKTVAELSSPLVLACIAYLTWAFPSRFGEDPLDSLTALPTVNGPTTCTRKSTETRIANMALPGMGGMGMAGLGGRQAGGDPQQMQEQQMIKYVCATTVTRM